MYFLGKVCLVFFRLPQIIRLLLIFFNNRYELFQFENKWRQANFHNYTCPVFIFPIHKVTVGDNTYGDLNIWSFGDIDNEKLTIGSYVSIAKNVHFILSGNHRMDTLTTYPIKTKLLNRNYTDPDDSISKGPIFVNDGVWIGFGCIILSGVTIGKGAVVAAGSVVTKNIPPFAIAGGNPAKVVKYRFSEDIIERMMDVDLKNISESFIEEYINELYLPLSDNLFIIEKIKK
jgi:virginiamycin A acetyltransferase